MSRNRGRDYVSTEIYGKHLHGDSARFANNPVNNRKSLHERMYFRILSELAMNRFKWLGLPKEIDVRFLEMNLFYRALAVFFHDSDTGKYMALQGGAAGPHNMYNNPTQFFVTGNLFTGRRFNSVNRIVNEVEELADCVPIWSNYLRVPDMDIVMIYATKLADIDMTIEINMRNARRTKVLAVDENTQLSVENLNRMLDEGSGAVKIARAFDMSSISSLDLGVHPDHIEKLHITKVRLWNECMGLLGIDHANQDKKERLISSEVNANDDQIDSMKAVNLNSRRMAADAIFDRYRIPIEVQYNTDIADQLSAATTGVGN